MRHAAVAGLHRVNRRLLTRPTLAKLALIVVGTLVGLTIAELLVRAAYRPVLDLRAIETWENLDFTPPLNLHGLREEPPGPQVFEDGVVRILMLGDSFTFGQGVANGADRFSDLVEARLNREDDERRFHVYNAGIPGSLPNSWSRMVDKLLPEYRPHLVVAVFFLRDGTALGTSLRFHEDRIEELRAKYDLGFLTRHSKVAEMFGERLAARDFQQWYLNQFSVAYLGNRSERQGWVSMQGWLDRIHDSCREQGVPLQMVIFPLLFGLDDYAYGPVEDEISRYANEAGIPIASLTPSFLGLDARKLWVSPSDQHPNELAHGIAADGLYPSVLSAIAVAR